MDTIAFSLGPGLRGSYNEDKFLADLRKLSVPGPAIAALMQHMAARCLASLGEIYSTRQVALQGR